MYESSGQVRSGVGHTPEQRVRAISIVGGDYLRCAISRGYGQTRNYKCEICEECSQQLAF